MCREVGTVRFHKRSGGSSSTGGGLCKVGDFVDGGEVGLSRFRGGLGPIWR